MAGDTCGMVKGQVEESFVDCRIVAVDHGMSFSGLKTEWIGFGDGDWGSCRLDGADVSFVDNLQGLGFRFGRDGSMDNYVKYWTQGGLEVRGRIGAIAQRFSVVGGIGAWEVMRLVQGAYLPLVEYCLEFVARFPCPVNRISIHVHDCLRSLFSLPFMLANNILHSECGILPKHIRAAYYKGRCAQRFLNYGYCSEFPWHGSLRNDWCSARMVPARMSSDQVLSTISTCFISPDMVSDKEEGLTAIAELALISMIVGFVDGSNKDTG